MTAVEAVPTSSLLGCHVSRVGSSLWLLGLGYSCPGNPSKAKETWSWVFVPTSGEENAFSSGVALLVPGAAPGSFASSWDYEANTEESRGRDTEKTRTPDVIFLST